MHQTSNNRIRFLLFSLIIIVLSLRFQYLLAFTTTTTTTTGTTCCHTTIRRPSNTQHGRISSNNASTLLLSTIVSYTHQYSYTTMKCHTSLMKTNNNNDDDKNENNNKDVNKKSSLIRLESQPDPSLANIQTKDDVVNKIKKIRSIQEQTMMSTLYQRHWVDKNEKQRNNNNNNNNHHHHHKTIIDGTSTFTVLQFNTLAEGLSSGLDIRPPLFEQKQYCEIQTCNNNNDNNNDINDKDGSINHNHDNTQHDSSIGYGGFTDIPHPEVCLDFALRRWRLMEVILGGNVNCTKNNTNHTYYGAYDIIALEEVDRYYGFFQPILKIFQYDGIFCPKPNSPGTKDGWYSDGCALFWNTTKFEFIDSVTKSYDVGNQIYIIVTLYHRDSQRIILVATTHLKAKQSVANEKIRTCQVDELVNRLSEKANLVAIDNNIPLEEIPIIVMGDFNSEPNGDGNTCIQSIISRTKSPSLQSAYDLSSDFFTTWKTRGDKTVRRLIDYIFHNDVNGFKCSHVLNIPEDHEIIEHNLLPSYVHPSDHMNIGAKFEVNVKKKKKNDS